MREAAACKGVRSDMVSRPVDATGELQRSLDLLTKNWVLAIPSAVASLLFAVFVTFVVLSALAGLGTLGAPLGRRRRPSGRRR